MMLMKVPVCLPLLKMFLSRANFNVVRLLHLRLQRAIVAGRSLRFLPVKLQITCLFRILHYSHVSTAVFALSTLLPWMASPRVTFAPLQVC